ncbi:F-box only protein 32 [Anastrepha obliqua]|uniref:F-box only protein 32 n=1 Tax=Anastrepha obliqua TaxID=95512 RepID=UPI002409DD5E|nr:F-box only protein 32 [Anastrepha obliqua]XP_054734292.1 F-box only protein 32 [Anastrepha obliqua]XP_054734293.1 F-box only protein 32 [Anastrepha obliqua]
MPFYSRDWRSPGEAWVKTDEGWVCKKVLECGKRKRLPSNSDDSFDEDSDEVIVPPHCHITVRCTREIAGFNGLGEVVRRLDFRTSLRNHKRFHYICALLRLLVSHKGIVNLSGSAQRVLMQIVEDVATHVNDSQQHLNVLRGLVIQLQDIVSQESQKCWGKPLGSTNLWQEHIETIKRIQTVASQIEIKEPGPEIRPKLHDLPEECIREIILRIADHKDLEASANAWQTMATLVSEQRIWRELCRFHFKQYQINLILDLNNLKLMNEVKDWKKMYHQLRRTYGVNDDYQFAEVLELCRICSCLFWPSEGHPCIADEMPDYKQRLEDAAGGGQLVVAQPVPPAQFLKYFSL